MKRPNMDALASAVIVLSLVALLLITGESVKLDGRQTRETLATVQTELDAARWLNDRLQRVALCALEGRRPARCLRAFEEREVDETPGPEPGETDPPGVTESPKPSPEPTPPPPDETESPEPTDDPIVDPSDIPTPELPTPTIPPVVCELLPILCE